MVFYTDGIQNYITYAGDRIMRICDANSAITDAKVRIIRNDSKIPYNIT